MDWIHQRFLDPEESGARLLMAAKKQEEESIVSAPIIFMKIDVVRLNHHDSGTSTREIKLR